MTSARVRTAALWLAALLAAVTAPTAIAGAAAPPGNGEIAFSVQFDTGQLYSFRPDQSPVVRLTTDLAENYQPVASPDGSRIAFSRGGSGRSDIFVMNRDGSGLANLTHRPGDDYDPMWSPDGKRIAFTSHRAGNDETYVMNAEGSAVRRVTRSRGDDENPSWLRDGRRLVISSTRAGKKQSAIFVVTIATGHAVRLTNDRLYNIWPQVSPDGRWIAYTRKKAASSSGDIVVMRADGRAPKAITHGAGDDGYAAWSPDSRCLVYVHGSSLYVTDRAGSHPRPVQPSAYGSDPSWARDGTIYFDGSDDDNQEIAVVGADGGPFRLLTEAEDDADIEPAWSPDGTRLLFQSDRNGDDELWIEQPDGTGMRNLTGAPRADDREPAWSPDGTRIAFTSDRGSAHNDAEIVVMSADGSNQVTVTNSPANDYQPAWSPDGRKIAFVRYADDRGVVWVMNADGSNQVRLTNGGADDEEPSWSPDGSKILFMSTRTGMPSIFLMNADGSDQHLLVRSGEIDAEPSWSPDGARIVFDRLTRDAIEIVVADADGSNAHVVALGCTGTDCEDAYPPDPSWRPLR
jgi:Tol biopolymer transport system component